LGSKDIQAAEKIVREAEEKTTTSRLAVRRTADRSQPFASYLKLKLTSSKLDNEFLDLAKKVAANASLKEVDKAACDAWDGNLSSGASAVCNHAVNMKNEWLKAFDTNLQDPAKDADRANKLVADGKEMTEKISAVEGEPNPGKRRILQAELDGMTLRANTLLDQMQLGIDVKHAALNDVKTKISEFCGIDANKTKAPCKAN